MFNDKNMTAEYMLDQITENTDLEILKTKEYIKRKVKDEKEIENIYLMLGIS